MSQVPRFLRQVVFVTLCLVLCVPLASSAPRSEPTAVRPVTLAEGFQLLVIRIWAKYGLGVDPSGARADSGEYGLGVDPDGATAAGSGGTCQGEYGAGYDPSGQCSDGQ